nr:putative reverse transcriptase domain-containing protein [Tanacetum cinerariifolium]
MLGNTLEYLRNKNHASMKKIPNHPQTPLTQKDVNQLVRDGIEAAIKAERERVREEAIRDRGSAGGPTVAPVARECTLTGFMKYSPTKVKFATATLHGRALTWWNTHVATLRLEVANGVLEIIKGETISPKPTKLNEDVHMAHTLIEQKIQSNNDKIVESNKRRWENNNQGRNINRNNNDNRKNNNNRNNRGNYHDNNRHDRYNQRRQDGARVMTTAQNNVVDQVDQRGGKATGRAYALRDVEQGQGPNVFNVILNISYEVELADGKLVSTNTVLRVKHDALIVCKKEVHIPVKGKMVVVKGNCDVSRLKVVSCIMARKYIEKGCHLLDAPTTPTEVRQFLVLDGYYRRFIKGFSLIAKPLTKLTQKNQKYEWGEDEEEAFQMLKQKLCSAPVLALPEGLEDLSYIVMHPSKVLKRC